LKLELVKRNNMLSILCGGKVLLSREVPSSFPQDYLLYYQVGQEYQAKPFYGFPANTLKNTIDKAEGHAAADTELIPYKK